MQKAALVVAAAILATAGALASSAVVSGAGDRTAAKELFHPGTAGTGEAFVDANGRAVMLDGFDQQPIWSGGLASSALVRRLRQAKDAGFNSMRYILFWTLMEPRRGEFAHLADLDQAVANARSVGMYVILEMIDASQGMLHIPSWARDGTDTIADITANAKRYVQTLAKRYATEATVVAYDPVNEPRQATADNTRVLRMYQSIIGWIRPIDRDKIVQIEPSWGSSSLGSGCADWSVLTSKSNTEIQVHDYYGGGGTGGIGWDGCVSDGTQMWRASASYPRSVRDRLAAHVNHYLRDGSYAGLPVYVGEYSAKAHAIGHDEWIRDTVAVLNASGLSRAWWQYHTHDPNSATDFVTWRWLSWLPLLGSGTATTPPTSTTYGTTTTPSTQPEPVLPDPALTPGVYNRRVRQSTIRNTICVRGWTRRVRPPVGYTDALKIKQMARYGETGLPSAYEEDHLIPLVLGGAARDPKNLWPEPRRQAKKSNALETTLGRAVCRHMMPLRRARRAIRAFKFANG
jgi:hypothetical protein